ncbi:MAG TPA: hypothetical protein VF669_18380 [Tepidisphaeraceae bacterium]|jgi:hypothetical protein
MKSYGDLYVELKGLSPEEFGDRAEAAATDGWKRDRSKDDEIGRIGVTNKPWFTFTLTGHHSLPPTFLFITEKMPNLLFVPNVISPARDRLEYDEYNSILRSFRDSVLSRIQPPDIIDVRLSNTSINLASQLPERVYKSLVTFSNAANKNTGSSHPLDRERWLDFLVEIVDSGVALSPETLTRWLVEEGKWNNDEASQLAEEYEFGRELLERRKQAS